ncbi:hypothetical protein BHM03_00052246 [Ensete ventricosum]|nr:hypothetical protein BHM03_00052246 [Ensete ventricosum]
MCIGRRFVGRSASNDISGIGATEEEDGNQGGLRRKIGSRGTAEEEEGDKGTTEEGDGTSNCVAGEGVAEGSP